MLFLFLILCLNFFISWANCQAVGRGWAESKALGGWQRVVMWSAAIMAACGFSYCYLMPAALIAAQFKWLPLAYAKGAMELGYLFIIFPIIGSGLAIWVDSLMAFYRERNFGSGAVAAYNTYAQIHNVYSAIETVPAAFSDVSKLMSSDDSDNTSLALMVLLVAVTLGAGILTASYFIRSSARNYSQAVMQSLK